LKRLLKKTAGFAVAVVGLYLLVIFIISNLRYKKYPVIIYSSNYYSSKGGHTYQALKEFNEDEGFDAVFLGSSHAYRGFDPRIFNSRGLKTFNLGTSGQDLEASELLYRSLIARKNVKTVVLEIFRRQLESSGNAIESSFEIAYNAPTFDIGLDYILEKRDWRYVNVLLYKFFTQHMAPVYYDDTYIGSGYSEVRDSVKTPDKNFIETFVPEDKKFATLERIIRLAKANNHNLVLVSHPLPKEMPRQPHYLFRERIAPLLKKYDIPYFDYTFNHDLHSMYHFYDPNHMNQSGVEIFNNSLLKNSDFRMYMNDRRG
jgi:hypothetical protein